MKKKLLLILLLYSMMNTNAQEDNIRAFINKLGVTVDSLNKRMDIVEGKIIILTDTLKKTTNKTSITEKASFKPIFDRVKSRIIENERTYNCGEKKKFEVKIISDIAFSNLIQPFYTKAVAGTDGVVKNGRALSYNFSDGKSTLGINHLIIFNKNTSKLLNININGNANGSFLNIVNNSKYNYGLSGSLKLSCKLYGKIFVEKTKCEQLADARKRNNTLILSQYKKILNIDTAKLHAEKRKLLDILNINDLDYADDHSYTYYKKLNDSLKKIEFYLKQFETLMELDINNGITRNIDEKIANFEIKNLDVKGYLITWSDFGIGYKLLGASIFNDTIYKANKITQKNFHRITGTIAYNILYNNSFLIYTNVGFNIFNRYVLENRKVKDFNFADTTGIITSFRGYNIKKEADINTCTFAFNPFITLMCYPGKNKTLGIEISTSYIYNPTSPNIADGRAGIIYSLSRDDIDKTESRTTIGLFLTLNSYDVSEKINNYFGVGFRVGVPLENLFNEKEK